MRKPIDFTLNDDELPPEGRAAYKAAQATLNGWAPTEHLRFVKRGPTERLILQQLWVPTGRYREYAEWHDIPVEDEVP